MEGTAQFNHVIVGSGPCAATVLDELLSLGINPIEVLLVTIPAESTVSKEVQQNIFLRSSELRQEGALSKGINRDLTLPKEISSPGEIWGTSCLPFSANWKSMTELEGLKEAYHITVAKWGVQASPSYQPSDGEYIYTGEEIGNLKRKQLAQQIVNKNLGFQHSRLALKSQKDGSACNFRSSCFTGCPSQVPYKPSEEILKLKTNHHFTLLYEEVKLFNYGSKTLQLSNGTSVGYSNLYLSAGCSRTLDILKRSDDTFSNYSYLTSSVMLLPFVSIRRSSNLDFFQSFLFHDLIFSVSKHKKQIGMAQLYLPTHEISSRVLSTLPAALSSFLSLFPNLTTLLLRHIGIAMIFLPGSLEIDTRHSIRSRTKPIVNRLRAALAKSGILLMPKPREYLLNEESMHLGGLGFRNSARGVNDAGISKLKESGVFVCDTSVLPDLPPGPSTAVASAFVRLIVRAAVNR